MESDELEKLRKRYTEADAYINSRQYRHRVLTYGTIAAKLALRSHDDLGALIATLTLGDQTTAVQEATS